MKYLSGNYYVEVKDKRHMIHPTEINILRQRGPTKFLGIHCQDQNDT